MNRKFVSWLFISLQGNPGFSFRFFPLEESGISWVYLQGTYCASYLEKRLSYRRRSPSLSPPSCAKVQNYLLEMPYSSTHSYPLLSISKVLASMVTKTPSPFLFTNPFYFSFFLSPQKVPIRFFPAFYAF